MKRFNRIKNLNGQRFGRLVAIGLVAHIKKTSWLCRCDCGVIKTVRSTDMMSGSAVSCGCWSREKRTEARTSHGESLNNQVSTEYSVFRSAKQRCTNPNNRAFKNYGGRGIEFRFTSVEQFIAAVGRRPSPDYSLDRIDNNGHYEVGNVRWATWAEQANNRRPQTSRSTK